VTDNSYLWARQGAIGSQVLKGSTVFLPLKAAVSHVGIVGMLMTLRTLRHRVSISIKREAGMSNDVLTARPSDSGFQDVTVAGEQELQRRCKEWVKQGAGDSCRLPGTPIVHPFMKADYALVLENKRIVWLYRCPNCDEQWCYWLS
jgi:hypothetical protein